MQTYTVPVFILVEAESPKDALAAAGEWLDANEYGGEEVESGVLEGVLLGTTEEVGGEGQVLRIVIEG